MAKEKKKAAPKKRGNYEEPLKVKGNFFEVMTAVVKDADKKSAPKKK